MPIFAVHDEDLVIKFTNGTTAPKRTRFQNDTQIICEHQGVKSSHTCVGQERGWWHPQLLGSCKPYGCRMNYDNVTVRYGIGLVAKGRILPQGTVVGVYCHGNTFYSTCVHDEEAGKIWKPKIACESSTTTTSTTTTSTSTSSNTAEFEFFSTFSADIGESAMSNPTYYFVDDYIAGEKTTSSSVVSNMITDSILIDFSNLTTLTIEETTTEGAKETEEAATTKAVTAQSRTRLPSTESRK